MLEASVGPHVLRCIADRAGGRAAGWRAAHQSVSASSAPSELSSAARSKGSSTSCSSQASTTHCASQPPACAPACAPPCARAACPPPQSLISISRCMNEPEQKTATAGSRKLRAQRSQRRCSLARGAAGPGRCEKGDTYDSSQADVATESAAAASAASAFAAKGLAAQAPGARTGPSRRGSSARTGSRSAGRLGKNLVTTLQPLRALFARLSPAPGPAQAGPALRPPGAFQCCTRWLPWACCQALVLTVGLLRGACSPGRGRQAGRRQGRAGRPAARA